MRLSAARVDSGQEKSALVACRPAKDAQSTLFRMGGGFSLSLLLSPVNLDKQDRTTSDSKFFFSFQKMKDKNSSKDENLGVLYDFS